MAREKERERGGEKEQAGVGVEVRTVILRRGW